MKISKGSHVRPSTLTLNVLAVALMFLFLSSVASAEQTGLTVTNKHSEEVTVGLVLAALGAPNTPCNSEHPPIKISEIPFCKAGTVIPGSGGYAGKCQFSLAAGETKTFPNPAGRCLSGALAFGDYGQCATDEFPDGLTQAEWTLNVPSGAEAVDISLVNGFNYFVEMNLNGSGWAYGPGNTAISSIANRGLNKNKGVPGVFPNGCTDCVQRINPPCSDPSHPSGNDGCQAERICNIQRYSTGGTVEIVLLPNS